LTVRIRKMTERSEKGRKKAGKRPERGRKEAEND
jgi:hypothetical protein